MRCCSSLPLCPSVYWYDEWGWKSQKPWLSLEQINFHSAIDFTGPGSAPQERHFPQGDGVRDLSLTPFGSEARMTGAGISGAQVLEPALRMDA
jgi:hypothetical protein